MVTQTLSRGESGVRADAPRKRLFTREEYHAMGEAGVFAPDERVELLEGEIVVMSPIGNRHAVCSGKLNHAFAGLSIHGRAIVWVQNPIVFSSDTEFQPDVMLLAFREEFYAKQRPEPADVLLLAEVSDSSLGYDRNVKLPRYAEAGIREVWIVNLQDDCVGAHTEPAAEGYDATRVHRHGESVSPSAFPDLKIAVSDVIPSRASGQ